MESLLKLEPCDMLHEEEVAVQLLLCPAQALLGGLQDLLQGELAVAGRAGEAVHTPGLVEC